MRNPNKVINDFFESVFKITDDSTTQHLKLLSSKQLYFKEMMDLADAPRGRKISTA